MTDYPPSWSDMRDTPGRSATDKCRSCGGRAWWTEAHNPNGWRCYVCHPPDHLPHAAVLDARTVEP